MVKSSGLPAAICNAALRQGSFAEMPVGISMLMH
jgi:hypothetical protein